MHARPRTKDSRYFLFFILCIYSPSLGQLAWQGRRGGVAPWRWRYIVRREVRGPVGGSCYKVLHWEALSCARMYGYSVRPFVTKFSKIGGREGGSWYGSAKVCPATEWGNLGAKGGVVNISSACMSTYFDRSLGQSACFEMTAVETLGLYGDRGE